MIFYFSGTGNSLYVAKELARQMNCEMVDMSVERNQRHEFHLSKDEPVGFVFPVYYYTVNDVVYDYIKKLTITGNGYTFAVVTCGGSIGGTGAFLKSELQKRNIMLDNVYPLKMPDNAVFYYNVVNKEQAEAVLAKSEKNLKEIMNQIGNEKAGTPSLKLVAKAMRPLYHAMASTKKFSVTDQCIHCGKCEKNCPDQAIKMNEGIPEWEKSSCVMCSACINRCPVQAIQYGRKTATRNRYTNPVIGK